MRIIAAISSQQATSDRCGLYLPGVPAGWRPSKDDRYASWTFSRAERARRGAAIVRPRPPAGRLSTTLHTHLRPPSRVKVHSLCARCFMPHSLFVNLSFFLRFIRRAARLFIVDVNEYDEIGPGMPIGILCVICCDRVDGRSEMGLGAVLRAGEKFRKCAHS